MQICLYIEVGIDWVYGLYVDPFKLSARFSIFDDKNESKISQAEMKGQIIGSNSTFYAKG